MTNEKAGYLTAIESMRNPLNSWDRNDSGYDEYGEFILGTNDLNLAQRLILAGNEHSKFMRFINVWFSVEAPLYWWKQFDTYKHVEKNSCSTMHKIMSKKLTNGYFSIKEKDFNPIMDIIIKDINENIEMYHKMKKQGKDEIAKEYFDYVVQILPSSYLQMRTCVTNYQQLRNIYKQRKNHKLEEWNIFCTWIETLPYAEELICI
jgi:hypothetical protein